MKKGSSLHSVLLIIMLIALLIILFFYNPNLNITGKIITDPTLPTNCKAEKIQKVWNSIFKESSSDIIIPVNITSLDSVCEKYFAYKIKNNQIFILYGVENESSRSIYALNGFFADNHLSKVGNITEYNLTQISEVILIPEIPVADIHTRDITIDIANDRFNGKFKPSPRTWEAKTISTLDVYEFKEEEISENETKSITGLVGAKQKINTYTFSYTFPLQKKAAVKGNLSDAYIDNVKDINLKINNTGFDEKEEYQHKQKLKFYENNTVIIEFNWNFSKEILNLKKVEIEKQNNNLDDYGYIVINGINTTKTVTLDRIAGADKICIRDEENILIGDVSFDCTDTNEYLIICNGTKQKGYKCTITNDTFTITGINHSAILEFAEFNENCIENWTCTNWGACIDGERERECVDINRCDTYDLLPEEFESCCIEDWICEEWSKCQPDGTLIRECEDKNDCGTLDNLPDEKKECEYKEFPLWIIITLVILTIGAVGIFIALHFINKSKEEETKTEVAAAKTQQAGTTPRSPPPGIMPPAQQFVQRHSGSTSTQ